MNFQNLKVHLKKFFEEELVEMEMESGNFHTYYMLNHRMRDLLFHSFCMVLSEHPTHHIRYA